MEKTLYLKRRRHYSYLKHPFSCAYILYVFVLHAEVDQIEVRVDLEEFSMGGGVLIWKPYCLFKQKEGRLGR